LPYNEATENGEKDLSCSLFSAAQWHGKNPDRLGGLDSRNGGKSPCSELKFWILLLPLIFLY